MSNAQREMRAIRSLAAITAIQLSVAFAVCSGQTVKVGDRSTAGSLHATVLNVRKTLQLVSSNVTLEPKGGYSLLAVTVRFENSGQDSATVTLPHNTTKVQSQVPPPQPGTVYDLGHMGVVFGDQSRFVFGSEGVMHLESPKGLWKLTGDFTNNVWSVTLSAGATLETLMVFTVSTEVSDFILRLPGFVPIVLGT